MITREQFVGAVGREPESDDLDRCNCEQAGAAGHFQCGWCEEHDTPRFACACGKNKHLVELHDSGVFEPVYSPFEIEGITFRVAKSDENAIIPNVGILPIVYDGSITIVFEDGVPHMLNLGLLKICNEMIFSVMSDEVYYRLLSGIIGRMNELACERVLYRSIERPGEWQLDYVKF